MPSQWNEPFGIVALESIATGTPVVTFNRGGPSEIIVNGQSGYVVETEDQMTEAVENAGRIKPESCRCRAMEFDSSVMADRYIDLYRRILEGDVK